MDVSESLCEQTNLVVHRFEPNVHVPPLFGEEPPGRGMLLGVFLPQRLNIAPARGMLRGVLPPQFVEQFSKLFVDHPPSRGSLGFGARSSCSNPRRKTGIHHRDTEDTERKPIAVSLKALCNLDATEQEELKR